MEYVPEFKPPSAKADQGGNFDAEVRAREPLTRESRTLHMRPCVRSPVYEGEAGRLTCEEIHTHKQKAARF